jgi:hypothetical protein
MIEEALVSEEWNGNSNEVLEKPTMYRTMFSLSRACTSHISGTIIHYPGTCAIVIDGLVDSQILSNPGNEDLDKTQEGMVGRHRSE